MRATEFDRADSRRVLPKNPHTDAARRDSPRIAVLTLRGSRYGRQLLRTLTARVGRPALVLVSDNSLQRRWRLLRSVAGRIGWRDAILYGFEETVRPTQPSMAAKDEWTGYGALADAVVHVPSVSSPIVADALRRHEIDLLLLGQSGIVPESVFTVPKIATLNAHPGWLPDYQGIDCAAWTVLDGRFDLIGSSLHRVDRGVDTGAIVTQRRYRWCGDETLQTLESRLYDDCIELLVEAVKDAGRGEFSLQPNAGGALFRKMPRAVRARACVHLARHVETLRAETRVAAEAKRELAPVAGGSDQTSRTSSDDGLPEAVIEGESPEPR